MNNFNEFCVFCGESKNLTTYKGTFICSDCYEKLKKRLLHRTIAVLCSIIFQFSYTRSCNCFINYEVSVKFAIGELEREYYG